MALEACHTEFASCKGETNPLPQLGNPAAQYCYFVLGNGLRKIQHAGLGESENCIMKDGIEIDEWELYFSDKLALCKVERYWCLDAAETDNVDTEICNSEYVVCSKGKE